jgi:hypothetical protein
MVRYHQLFYDWYEINGSVGTPIHLGVEFSCREILHLCKLVVLLLFSHLTLNNNHLFTQRTTDQLNLTIH